MTQASVRPHPSSAWLPALRRGAILGVVAACHLALLMLMRPTGHREPRQRGPRSDDHVLRLVFIRASASPPVAGAAVRHRQPPPAPRSRQPTPVAPHMPSRPTSTVVIRLPLRPTTDQYASDYREGDFRHRLLDAQRTGALPLPGGAAPRVGGFRLRVAPSARDLLRQLTVATRCTAEVFKMRDSKTQFITAQLMDRALEADGCGPHTERDSASDVVDAVTRQLMDER